MAGLVLFPTSTTVATVTTGTMMRKRSLLYMSSNTPISPEQPPVVDENLREEDPIEFLAQEVKVMDINAIIK
jgi:hypothetical protein